MLEIPPRRPGLLAPVLVAGWLALSASLAAAPHWVPVGPYGGLVSTLTVDPATSQTLYATSFYQGSFKSLDGGATWIQIHAGPVSGNVAVDPGQPSTIYESFNFNQVAKSVDGGGTLWEASGSQVFASHNGGATWHSAGGPQAFIQHLIPDPAHPDRLYAVTDGGVWVLEP